MAKPKMALVKNSNRLRAPAPAPGPAPGPSAEEIRLQKIEEMKKKMASKVGHYDADYVLDRPNIVAPGHDGQVPPGPKSNLVPNAAPAKEEAAGAPGAAP